MNPSVYREAAERIADGRNTYPPEAIDSVVGKYGSEEEGEFCDMFRLMYGVFWGEPSFPENQLARSLALLIMAEIAEDME